MIQIRKNSISALYWLAALLAAVIVVGLVLSVTMPKGRSATANTGRASMQMDCAGKRTVSARVDYGVMRDQSTPSPDEQARRWASAMSMKTHYPHLQRAIAYKSDRRTKISFTDGADRTVAVLSYARDSYGGWHLAVIDHCEF